MEDYNYKDNPNPFKVEYTETNTLELCRLVDKNFDRDLEFWNTHTSFIGKPNRIFKSATYEQQKDQGSDE